MAASSYDEALRRLLVHEGGYSNHPSDPGGPTNFGITIGDYRKYVNPSATPADIRAMPLSEAKAIYREKYWNAMRCDELPGGLDYAVFDYGVNSGVSRAVKVLQRLVGLNADGRMDDALLATLARHDAADLVARLCDERLSFLKSLSTWPVFGAGWGRRAADVRRAGLALARGTVAEEPHPNASGRASMRPGKAAPGAAAGGAVIAGGVATQAAHAAGASWPAIVGIVLLTLLMAVACWFGWQWWQARRQDAPVSAEVAGLCSGLCRTLKGWKTLAFGSAVAASGMIADLLDALQAIDISPLLPPSYAVKIIAAIGVITIMLRFATTGRVGQKDH